MTEARKAEEPKIDKRLARRKRCSYTWKVKSVKAEGAAAGAEFSLPRARRSL